MAKSANIYARIEPELKDRAENILATLGIPASSAITMFYRQIVLRNGIPFDIRLPAPGVLDIHSLQPEQLDAELEKGYKDMMTGRTRSASDVFSDCR